MTEQNEHEPTTTAERRRATDQVPRWLRLMLLFMLPAYIVLAIAVAIGFRVQGDETNARRNADRQLLIQTAIDSCEDRNFTKQALRDTITTALSSSDGGGGDLTQIEGFDDLPTSVQTYLTNLSRPRASDTPSRADRLRAYRDGLLDEDCEALGEQLDAELSGSS